MKLTKQREIPFSPPDLSDEEVSEVIQSLKSGWITTGPKTKKFEKKIAEYLGTHSAVCLNSATAAMELTLRILGVGPGDEVITSAYTYTATAAVIAHVGAKIVLVDTAEDSLEMDYQKLSEAITERTKVIIPVDIGGVMCDYNTIFNIVQEKSGLFNPKNLVQQQFNRIIVMADSAHAFGAERYGKKSGQVADFTCFSFHAVKNLTTAEGGAVTWVMPPGLEDNYIYNQYMLYSLHGQSKDALAKTKKGSWEYDIIFPGYKSNMTDISASIGLIQLDRYKSLLEKRQNIINRYDQAFLKYGLKVIEHLKEDSKSSGHLYIVRIPDISEKERNEIIIKMADVGVSCNVHYKPLPLLTAYKEMGFNIEDYTNAYNMYKNAISLPLHTSLTDEDVEYVINSFINIIHDYLK